MIAGGCCAEAGLAADVSIVKGVDFLLGANTAIGLRENVSEQEGDRHGEQRRLAVGEERRSV